MFHGALKDKAWCVPSLPSPKCSEGHRERFSVAFDGALGRARDATRIPAAWSEARGCRAPDTPVLRSWANRSHSYTHWNLNSISDAFGSWRHTVAWTNLLVLRDEQNDEGRLVSRGGLWAFRVRMTQYRLRAPFLGLGQEAHETAGKSRIPIEIHAAIHRAW